MSLTLTTADYQLLTAGGRRPHQRPTREEILEIKACFISMRDVRNRVMLSWFWPRLPEDEKRDWLERWRAAGLTHVMLCPVMSYPNNGLGPNGSHLDDDWRGQPARFAAAVVRILEEGFVPIIQMTSGDGGTGGDIDRFWPDLLEALTPVLPFSIGSCGFEVAGGGWRSAEISRGVRALHTAGFAAIMLHPQAERSTGASYGGDGPRDRTPQGYVWVDYRDPVRPGIGAYIEDDDPWQGDEPGFWKSHGGELVDILFYQTPHGSKLLDPNGAGPGVGSWEDRWIEVIERSGLGGRGWRKVRLCMGEKTGLDYFHGGATDHDVVRTSARARELCAARGVTCGLGDGL